MKRVAFLGYNEPDGKNFGNGVVRVIYNQAQMLKERGYEVFYYHLFSREQYRGLNSFLRENAIDVAVWHMTTLKFRGHLHTPCPLICLWHNTPIFHHDTSVFCEKYHVKPVVSKLLRTRLMNWLFVKFHDLFNILAFTYVTACADKMVLLSEKFRSIFFPAKLFPHKVTAISNFLDKQFLDVDVDWGEKQKEVLYMGRLENNQKRVDLLLKIWEKIEKCYSVTNWKLNICGGGVDEAMLKRMKDDLGLKNVFFRGFVNPADYYRTASVFCLTSAMEGFGLVLVESAAYGCVPMAFDSYEAASDLITDGENGRLIKPFDTDAYAEALYKLMEDDNERKRLAENAKRDVKSFDPDLIMDQWEKLFGEVLEKR